MTSELLVSTLTPIVSVVVANSYVGTASKYITYNYADTRAELFADNVPISETDYLQIHLFCDRATNPETDIKKIKNALFKSGFEYPTITRLYENETQKNHIIFTTEYNHITNLED